LLALRGHFDAPLHTSQQCCWLAHSMSSTKMQILHKPLGVVLARSLSVQIDDAHNVCGQGTALGKM